MPYSSPCRVVCCFLSLVVAAGRGVATQVAAPAVRPNIVWISAEDISPHLGCYGDPHAITPHLDQLATEGVRYTHAFTTAGVCAPCRSGIITGVYQTSLGTHHMRCAARLPDAVRPFPAYLREQGYYTTNNSKEDYQFKTPPDVWDDSSRTAHWRHRPRDDQPFFAVFNFTGCHESGIADDQKYREVTANLSPQQRQDPAALTTLPPYYPDTPVTREDWKRNYELITAMDAWAGDLIDQLKQDGLLENTIVMFWSDHGVGLPRAKRWLYDSGTHIPLIVRTGHQLDVATQVPAGTVRDELVSSIDLGPTVMNLAGVKIPADVQGQPFLGPDCPPNRQYVYGARDRMDERYDIIRMVRDKRFKYLRNYEPLKACYQYINTAEKGATMRELRRVHLAGQLTPVAEQFFNLTKPVEELYDTLQDPHELTNLAGDTNHAATLERLRAAHLAWVAETKDLGLIPEPILAQKASQFGHPYGVLRQPGGDALADRITRVAVAAAGGAATMPQALEAVEDQDPAVRYWGAVGLASGTTKSPSVTKRLTTLLEDRCAAVSIAAAHGLCRAGKPAKALPTLVRILQNGTQWERLQAAIVLDEIDQQAAPVEGAMQEALTPRPDLLAGGKYTIRVLNHALNELRGTNRTVP
jgi:uncharacterized sulfatase